MKSVANKDDKLSRGDKVIARDDMFGYYYNGKVVKITDARHVDIHSEKDGAVQIGVSIRNVVKLTGAAYLCVCSFNIFFFFQHIFIYI